MSRDSNVWALMREVNQLLAVDLGRDSIVDVTHEIFAENLRRVQGIPASTRLPDISTDCEDRISFMSKFFTWIPEKPEVLQKFTKNSKVSTALRSKGNALFIGQGNMQRAMQLYNLAIMFAEPAGEELGLAFGNRSALLLEQQDPAGSLKDIDLAMKHNYPVRLVSKLEKRREKCVKMLEEFERSHMTEGIKSDVAERRKYRDELLKLKNPNPLISCAENFVDIGHTDEVGRQLVVNEDIAEGTVVIVERPFTLVDEGLLKFEATHCDNCYKFVKNGIPCKHCTFVLYCSEECRSNTEYGHHKFECSCLSSLYLGSVNAFHLVAFRVVCKVGPDEFYRLFTTRDPTYFDIRKPFGTEPGCKYESDSYLPIHHLYSHSSALEHVTRYVNGLYALQLTSILEAQTNFFQMCPEGKTKEFKNFVTATLLSLMESLRYNGMIVEEIKALQGRTLGDLYRLKEVKGTIKEELCFDQSCFGIYSLGSLLSHSCDPNVVRVFDSSHRTMAVVITRAVKKGEPLTTTYGAMHDTSDLMERQAHLKRGYSFRCYCVACNYDWPSLDILLMKYRLNDHEFTCPSCSKKFKHEEKCSDNFLKCCLNGDRPTCGLCAKSYKREELKEVFRWAMKKYVEVTPAIKDNRPFEVVEIYKELSAYFQFNIRPPHAITAESRFIFLQALALILQCE